MNNCSGTGCVSGADPGIYLGGPNQGPQSKVKGEAQIEGAKRPSIEGEARVEGAMVRSARELRAKPKPRAKPEKNRGKGLGRGLGEPLPSPRKF